MNVCELLTDRGIQRYVSDTSELAKRLMVVRRMARKFHLIWGEEKELQCWKYVSNDLHGL